jgi:hypothetical protein
VPPGAYFLVCISKVNHTLAVAQHSSDMGLHLLGADQLDLARLFGEETGDLVDKFASVDWRLGSTGAPLLVESAVSMEGQILGHFSVGDHEAFLMRAVRSVAGGHRGILTYRAAQPLQPGHSRVAVPPSLVGRADDLDSPEAPPHRAGRTDAHRPDAAVPTPVRRWARRGGVRRREAAVPAVGTGQPLVMAAGSNSNGWVRLIRLPESSRSVASIP